MLRGFMNPLNKALECVAIIPARAGSKRLPKKNSRALGGIPLVQWTINSAVASGIFDLIVVSSDDSEILEIAKESNLYCIVRPRDLASDEASTQDVIKHALQFLHKDGYLINNFMLLQPTSPLRSAKDIKEAHRLMVEQKAECVVSVCPAEHSPLWCNTLNDKKSMKDFLLSSSLGKRSQELPTFYRLNGSIYLAKVKSYIEKNSFFFDGSIAYIMPCERSVDIDTEHDFNYASYLISI